MQGSFFEINQNTIRVNLLNGLSTSQTSVSWSTLAGGWLTAGGGSVEIAFYRIEIFQNDVAAGQFLRNLLPTTDEWLKFKFRKVNESK